MPGIKAFKGIHPSQSLVSQVVLSVENLSLSEAKSIRDKNPYSFVNMLVPKLENRFLMGSKTELAFKKINENFDDFLDKGILQKDEQAAIYVYRVSHYGFTQMGFWTLTAIDDYLNNTVKKHELTRAERERGLVDYLQHTGMDANPVLIAYPEDSVLTEILANTVKSVPLLDFSLDASQHGLWKITDEKVLTALIARFAALSSTYIADGHHRAAAASSYGIERRKYNLKHRGNEEYNFFSSVYMDAEQLRIFEFHRLVKDLGKLTISQFLEKISEQFTCRLLPSTEKNYVPSQARHFGLYIAGNWYELVSKKTEKSTNPVADLDVSILQTDALQGVLGISDPRTDSRLSFAGGLSSIEELVKKVDDGVYDILFTLYPTSIEELFTVADAGEVMPPKSTWFEPKFPSGLLVHQLS
ncbi:MAG: DUF1015 domain-containing protein [Sphingobacteriaceae bacterium]